MANTVPQSGRAAAAAGGRRCRAPTRRDLLTFLVAAMLCSASYCLGIRHTHRGAADGLVLGLRAADADELLDFEAHHAAEGAGLSVSASPAASRTTSARRALRGHWTAAAGNPVPGADAAGGRK